MRKSSVIMLKKLILLYATVAVPFLCITVYASSPVCMDMRFDEGTAGEGAAVVLSVPDSVRVSAMQFVLEYDEDRLEYRGSELCGVYSSMVHVINDAEPGEIRVAAAALDPVGPGGDALKIRFAAEDSDALLFEVRDAVFYDDGENEIRFDDFRYIFGPAAEDSGIPGSGVSGVREKKVEPVPAVFNDISGSWAEDYIERAHELGLAEGYGDGRFGPEDLLTRAQMAQLLWNSAGRPEPISEPGYTDLSDDWYRKSVAWVTEQGLFRGLGGGIFAPDENITREQVLQVLFNMSGGKNGAEALFTDIYDANFTDSGGISLWAKPAVYWAVFRNIVCGTDSESVGTELKPVYPADRAQVAVMLVKYRDSYKGNAAF